VEYELRVEKYQVSITNSKFMDKIQGKLTGTKIIE
jgi:hypothetical protein